MNQKKNEYDEKQLETVYSILTAGINKLLL